MTQLGLPLTAPVSGQILKAQAIEQVRENASDIWKRAALAAVKRVCEEWVEFTTDAVWDEIVRTSYAYTHEPRAMGAVMTDAARSGWCRHSGRVVPSVRRECHRRPLAVWISSITKEQGL